jgi:hypothetical protein
MDRAVSSAGVLQPWTKGWKFLPETVRSSSSEPFHRREILELGGDDRSPRFAGFVFDKIIIDCPAKSCFLLVSAGSTIGGPTDTGVIDANQNSPMVLTEHGIQTNLSEHSRKHDSSNFVKHELVSSPMLPIRALAKHDFPRMSTE